MNERRVHRLQKKFSLSKREIEVLKLISTCQTDREISEYLFVSAMTIGKDIRNIKNKLGLKTHVELGIFAYKNKIK